MVCQDFDNVRLNIGSDNYCCIIFNGVSGTANASANRSVKSTIRPKLPIVTWSKSLGVDMVAVVILFSCHLPWSFSAVVFTWLFLLQDIIVPEINIPNKISGTLIQLYWLISNMPYWFLCEKSYVHFVKSICHILTITLPGKIY